MTAGAVGQVKIHGHNGNYTFDAVQGSVDIDSHHGHTMIGTYSGSDARLSTHNGSMTLSGARGCQDLDVRTDTFRDSVTKL
ncbi:hypothetical protein ACFT8P_14050 [Streptomyces sp. NPDC057101]|uniref:hypothetical protein n=1 Tax=Streptomyces sp. NPDC057101 TaxID=3346020 RepID=UPI00363A5512